MKKIINYILILGISYFTFISCSSSTGEKKIVETGKDVSIGIDKKDDKVTRKESKIDLCVKPLDSKQLFDKAIELQRENGFFLTTSKDTQVFVNSASLMEKAISLDTKNLNLYTNLAKVYFKLDNTEKAIQVLDNLFKVDSSYVEAISSQGFIYEKIGEREKACKKYKKALDVYSFRLNKEYGDYVNRAFLIMLLYGEKSALEELEKINRKYPEEDVSFFEYQFQNFDRGNFIKNSIR